MKTLRTKTIDDIEIITGIGKLSICGPSTRDNCKDKISELPESQKLVKKGNEGIELLRKARAEKKKAKAFFKIKEDSKAYQHSEKCKKFYGAADLCDDEMREIKKLIFPKQRDILRNNPHFHEPGRGLLQKLEGEKWPEYFARSQKLEQDLKLVGPNQKLKTDGSIIPDFVGVKYSKKIGSEWGFGTIIKLGVEIPAGAIIDEDLTEDQKTEINIQNEKERVAGLSAEDKAIEKAGLISGVANQAQTMENELKFSKVADYVKKAQAFYDAEIIKINDKYGE